jgi:hypothetical protein
MKDEKSREKKSKKAGTTLGFEPAAIGSIERQDAFTLYGKQNSELVSHLILVENGSFQPQHQPCSSGSNNSVNISYF